ncbi:AlkA N-terminal domain-containing protein [Parafrigoribacterium soli]|uniref:AlkA N-terminal domain-containing protein n=1 Tax=Parafrigoribacterium soli TaxID=3144663 RepID=UPI0032EF7D1E
MNATPAVIAVNDPLFAERYRAMSSRDSRFDGQFITGVHSTGIYCRPSCPATTPRPTNVTFYRTAAAAHEAGLRACKRCLPDAVPGSSDWRLHDDLAARAMRLIADGVVEREGVSGLASRLGYTPRHLGRVLVQELGAGPLALARANRAQTARTLLTSTELPIADVAFAAGFASIRQFNDTVLAVYETTPTELRALGIARARRRGARRPHSLETPGAARATSITLRLPARQPFDGAGLMRFFADHAIPGIETSFDAAAESHFRRAVRLPHGTATVDLALDQTTPGATALRCTARLDNVTDLASLVSRVRLLFDLDADAAAIDAALSADPALAPSVHVRPGIRLPGSLDAEETLFRTLIGQQISVKAARTVLGRIAAELGEGDEASGTRLFPTAARIAEEGRGVLRGPASRIATVLGVAEALASGSLVLDIGMPVDELTARLVALPGVGPWTAGYLAMRVLGNPDVLLTSDLVMLQSAAKLGLPSTARGLADYGARWAPWRSYAGLHLWRSR